MDDGGLGVHIRQSCAPFLIDFDQLYIDAGGNQILQPDREQMRLPNYHHVPDFSKGQAKFRISL